MIPTMNDGSGFWPFSKWVIMEKEGLEDGVPAAWISFIQANSGWAPQAGALGTEGFLLFPAFLELCVVPRLCVVGDGGGLLPWFFVGLPLFVPNLSTHTLEHLQSRRQAV